MKRPAVLGAILAPLLLLVAACPATPNDQGTVLGNLSFSGKPQAAWRLPKRLREISALAMSPDHRLFAVDDEQAIIYEIDYSEGRISKAFAVGKPALRADFEGLAIVDTTFYLMTSKGKITRTVEGSDGEHVAYDSFSTGLGKQCEFEGLAADPRSPRLLLLCKNLHRKADFDVLSIFSWDTEQQHIDETQRIELPVDAAEARLGSDSLRPSGLAVHPSGDALVLVAARERALVEIDFTGALRNAIELPGGGKHPQAEGIEFGLNRELIIADEGGKGRARLTVYGEQNTQ